MIPEGNKGISKTQSLYLPPPLTVRSNSIILTA